MIKRLKRRFVFVNMSILTCVLLSILVAVFALMYSSEVKLSYEFMESLMSQKEFEHRNRIPDDTVLDNNTVLDVSLMSYAYNNGFDGVFFENNFEDDMHKQQHIEPVYTDRTDDKQNGEDEHFKDDEMVLPPTPEDNQYQPTEPKFSEPFFKPEPSESVMMTTSLLTEKQTIKTSVSKTEKNSDVQKSSEKKGQKNTDTDIKPSEKKSEILPSERSTVTKPELNINSDFETRHTEPFLIPEPEKPANDFIPKTEPDPFQGKVKRSYVYVEFNEIDDIENAIYQYFTEEDDVAVKEAVSQIYNDNDESGKITIGNNKYRYMFRFNPVESSYSIVMLDRTLEINTINRLMFIFIIIAGAGLFLIFLISVLLANWTIKPVEKAWNQQKEFIANASHELKTPLTVISTNTDVVLSYPEDTVESQTKWLNYIKNETVRMSKLVNNLLCIAKYDAKRIETACEKVDLSNIVVTISLQYEPLAFENKKTLITDIDSDIQILGDDDKIKQVVNILMDNALKYSLPDGTIKLSLKRIKQSSVCLTVSNTSENIEQEQLDKIFDRFYRVDTSRNRKTGGSGLGLNIAKTIVENHKGTINVVNKDNITSFIVTF